MRIISTATSFDGKEIHSTVSLASGKTLNLVVRRVGPGMCTISPNYEDMIDEVTADEYTDLDSLTSAFSGILTSEDWVEEEAMIEPMEILVYEDKKGLWSEIDGRIFRGDNCFLLDSNIRDGGFGGNHNLRYKGERELES